jgi:hypothetical protein
LKIVLSLTSLRFTDIKTNIYTFALRRALYTALILLLVPAIGISQFTPTGLKFFENGQPTRKGADAGMFPDSPTRLKLDLAGTWRFSLNGTEWNNVTVPSAYDLPGKVTFLRTFEIKPEMLDKYAFSLVVYGINYQSEITINGNFIGRHMGGYSSFVLPIPQNTLQVGSENAIKISVDNVLTPKTTLPLRQQVGGWRTYGGIFRDIYLLATPRLYIDGVGVKSDLFAEGKTGKFFVQCDISDRGSGVRSETGNLLGFQIEVYDKLSGELAGRSGISPLVPLANKSTTLSSEVMLGTPKVWSPETPDLYVLKCQIARIVNKEIAVLDEFDLDAGFHDLQWKEGRLNVNGILTPLKGILWQEDHPTYGSAMTYEAMERDIATIKTLGVNLIRFRYSPHPYILNLCDRYGLFVMEEIPLVNVPAEILSKDYFQDLATNYIKEMVLRDRHHTSMLAWGIGDEFESTSPGICDYVNGMRSIVKSLDSRLVYYAARSVSDPCFEYVDMVAINNYGGDAKEFREQLKQWKLQEPEKPIVLARYGQEVEPGNRNGYSDPLSAEAQARHAMQFFDAIKEAKIAGSVLWAFNDWRTDRPALTAHSKDPYLQSLGIVGYERDKRTAFDVVRALFNGEKVQALPVGNYASSTPIVYVVAGLIALISFAFLYNANRRFRDCVNRSLFRTYNFFADVRDQRILSVTHSVFLAVIASITWATMLSSIFSYYRDSVILDNLLNQFLSDDLKEWFVRLVWSPVKFILIISALVFVKLMLISVLVRIFSMVVRTRVYFYHAFSITMWSILPYIVFIPLAMILYRLLDTEFYVVPIFVFVVLVSVWVLLRLLKGVSIIFDVIPIKVYTIGLLLIVVCAVVMYGYFDYTQSTSVYLKYLMHTMKSPL